MTRSPGASDVTAPGSERRERLCAIDLFCGAGGLTEGLRQARFRVVAAVDNDELAVESYKLNHKRTRVWRDDVAQLNPATVMRALGLSPGDLDLHAGCPPCQGFSSMRTRNGKLDITDEQNDLVFEFVRWARAFQPRAVMLENFPALRDDARMVRVRAALRKLGYHLLHDVLNAAKYGVPQRRRRFILVGLRDGNPRFAPEVRRRRTVRDAIGDLPAPGSGDDLGRRPVRREHDRGRLDPRLHVRRQLRARRGPQRRARRPPGGDRPRHPDPC